MLEDLFIPLAESSQNCDGQDCPCVGIHLRTTADAVTAGKTKYEAERQVYLDMISLRSLAITGVYASSGNQTSVKLFVQAAATLPRPVSVVTKAI